MKAFALLQQSLSGIGWQVRHRVMSYGHSENRAAQWDRMVEAETPDALVVWTGRPALGGWAVSRGLRVLFMGGAREDLPVPVFAVRSPDMVDRALRELAARGHRRFCLPMCNRAAGTVRTIRAVASKCLRSHGLRGKEHVPVSAYEGGHVIEAMARQALSERSPTGWIFFDWREFLAASCVFRDQGLAIPGDISVVLLSWDPAMDWFRPAVAHFRHPLDRMVKAVAEWVLEGDGGTGTRYFAPEWVPGASLGQAPG